jgi:hypothetical protein
MAVAGAGTLDSLPGAARASIGIRRYSWDDVSDNANAAGELTRTAFPFGKVDYQNHESRSGPK